MKFIKYLFLALAISLASNSEATQRRNLLTKTTFGNLVRLHWTGSTYALSADTAFFYADTNVAAPKGYNTALLFSSFPVGARDAIATYPGYRFPEKWCTSATVGTDADGSTTAFEIMYATRNSSTFITGSPQATATTTATGIKYPFSFPMDPGSDIAFRLITTSATDSSGVSTFDAWPCDD